MCVTGDFVLIVSHLQFGLAFFVKLLGLRGLPLLFVLHSFDLTTCTFIAQGYKVNWTQVESNMATQPDRLGLWLG